MDKSNLKRGIKRKRGSAQKEEDTHSALRAKLYHGLKEVKKAAKRAKAFETQRIVKKLKEARQKGDNDSVDDLEKQLSCLKAVNHGDFAIRSLRSKTNKDKLLKSNDDCQQVVKEMLNISSRPEAPSKALEVAEGRLQSSKILSEEVKKVVQSLRVALGEGDATLEAAITDTHSELAIEELGDNVQEDNQEDSDSTSEDQATSSDDVKGDDVNYWEGFNDEGPHESQSSRSSESSSADESPGSVSTRPSSTGRIAKRPQSEKGIPKTKQGLSAGAGESTFLPSLSVGFVDGSDSDWSDADADAADAHMKKNRRGQRARKAIWEKKYGKNANHLKKQREEEAQATVQAAYGRRGARGKPGAISDPRGGNVSGRGPGRSASHGHVIGSSAGGTRGSDDAERARDWRGKGGRSGEVLQKERTGKHAGAEEKPLHPSWEAKKKLKEKQSAAIRPSQGTRMVFT